MRWVPSAVKRPNHCAAIPFIAGHHPEGFFDFGTEICAFDGHVYVSVVAAKQMAEYMGWAPKARVNPLAARVAQLEADLAVAEEKNVELERFRESARHAMEQFGQKIPARKPGRPKTKETV
jgi:hypothetical protein